MNKKVLLVSSLLVSLMGYSQTVKGRVVQHDNPVSNASIILKKGDKEMTSMTDASGFFNVTLTEGGSYTISIVAEGANPLENQITVEDNGVLDLGNVIVYQMVTSEPMVEEKPVVEQPTEPTEPVVAKNTTDPNEPQDEEEDGKVKKLQTVELLGRARKDYSSDYSFSASKIALKNMEVSQAITTVTKELLADRGITRLGDVVKNVSGVNQASFYNDYAIRGVKQENTYRENRMINGMATSHILFSQPMMMNVERVEVIKGPASMTFSSTDAGGTINIVTKKPLKSNMKEVSFSVGSWGNVVSALDFTGPLNKSKTLLYRLNLGYENGKSFRHLQFKKAYQIAPTVAYIPNDKTSISFEFVLTDNNNRLDRGQPIFYTPGTTPSLHATPISYAIGALNDYNKTLDLNFMVNFTHKFADNLSLNMAYMKHRWNEDLVELRTDNNFGRKGDGSLMYDKVEMRYVQRYTNYYTDNFNAYLNYDWKIGDKIKNKSVLGYDIITFELANSGYRTARGYKTVAGGIRNSYSAARSSLYQMDANGNPIPNVPHWNLTGNDVHYYVNPSDYIMNVNVATDPLYFMTNAGYVMNQMELWDKLIVNLGLRHEWYVDKNYYGRNDQTTTKKNKLLFRAGLMYKATKNINAYASYIEGFQMQTDAYLGYNGFRQAWSDTENKMVYVKEPFNPRTTKMYEIGAKTEWLDGKLHANLALYSIKQNNVLTYDDRQYNGAVDELMSEGGTEKNKGIEVDLMGRITKNWMVNIGYAFNDSKLTYPNGETYQKSNAPKHMFNFWSRYDIKEGFLRNVGFGLGANYSSDKVSWQERDLVLPSYVVFDAAAYYKLGSMQLSFNVNNIFNKTYWLGAYNYPRLFPGTPRNVLFTVKYTF